MHLPIALYTFGGGRLGNQLIRFAHWLAWAKENHDRVGLVDAAFWPYAKYFKYWSGRQGCGVPRDRGWAKTLSWVQAMLPDRIEKAVDWRILHALHAFGGVAPGWQQIGSLKRLAEINLDDPAFLATVERSRVTACAGWKIAGWDLFEKHDQYLREMLAPHDSYVQSAKKKIEPLKDPSISVVGILIRQTDYRTWNNGAFYFPTNQYVAWMKKYQKVHSEKSIKFVIASDEVQDPAAFEGIDVSFSTGSANVGGLPMQALLELSLCERILAPPSTFAAWAAHWGRVPYWPLGADESWLKAESAVPGSLNHMRHNPALSFVVM